MNTLANGIHTQHYRAASGYSKHRKTWLEEARSLGVVGIAEHGGLTVDTYRRLRDESQAAGYQSGACVGPGDFGSELNAAKYGRQVGLIFKHADYGVTDLEGQHEDDAMDVAKVSAFYSGIRETAPDVILIDQPPSRPIPNHHGSLVWRLSAKWVNYRAPMLYANNLISRLGLKAWERIWPDYKKDWDEWVPANTPAGIVADPWFPTLQAYHWYDWTAAHAFTRSETFILWCENHQCSLFNERSQGPYPTEQTRASMRRVAKLKALGFAGPDAVAAFQRAHGLFVDNKLGKVSGAKLDSL